MLRIIFHPSLLLSPPNLEIEKLLLIFKWHLFSLPHLETNIVVRLWPLTLHFGGNRQFASEHLALSTPILVFHFFSRFLFHQFLWTSDFILAYCLLHFPFTSHKGQNAFFNRLQVAILSFLLISFLSETIFLRHALLLDVWSHALFFFSYTVIYFSKSSLFLLFLFYL